MTTRVESVHINGATDNRLSYNHGGSNREQARNVAEVIEWLRKSNHTTISKTALNNPDSTQGITDFIREATQNVQTTTPTPSLANGIRNNAGLVYNLRLVE